MSLVRFGTVSGLLFLAVLTSSGCDRCSLRLLDEIDVTGDLPCCGGSASEIVAIPDGTNRQVDLANTRFPNAEGQIDLWLTPFDCTQLFDSPYPGATPRCRTLIGPIAPGVVSPRMNLNAGTYRVFAQAHATNTTAVHYVGDIGVWGNDCGYSPVRP